MRRLLLGIAGCLAFITCITVVVGMQPQTKIRESHFSTREKRFPIPAHDDLTVRIGNQSDYGIVAIEAVKDVNQITVKAWKVEFDETVREVTGSPKFNSINPLDETNIKIAEGSIIVDGDVNSRTVVKVTVPMMLKVALYINDHIIRAGPITRSVLVRGLSLIDTSRGTSDSLILTQAIIAGPSRVPVQVLTGESIISPSKTETAYKVPWNALRGQAVGWSTQVDTGNSRIVVTSSDVCVSCTWAMVTLNVDQSGVVTDVKRATGNKGIADAAAGILRSWRFHPFIVNGQAVNVTSDVPVKVVDGKIIFEADN